MTPTPPLTEASAREVWRDAIGELLLHDRWCARCTSSLFRCDRGAELARVEGSAWKLVALASVEGDRS